MNILYAGAAQNHPCTYYGVAVWSRKVFKKKKKKRFEKVCTPSHGEKIGNLVVYRKFWKENALKKGKS